MQQKLALIPYKCLAKRNFQICLYNTERYADLDFEVTSTELLCQLHTTLPNVVLTLSFDLKKEDVLFLRIRKC